MVRTQAAAEFEFANVQSNGALDSLENRSCGHGMAPISADVCPPFRLQVNLFAIPACLVMDSCCFLYPLGQHAAFEALVSPALCIASSPTLYLAPRIVGP